MRLRDALDRLPDARQCAGGWAARCPAHEDSRPSLSIRAGDKGHAILKCFAGCEYTNIVHALRGEPVEHLFKLSSGAGRPALNDATRIVLARRIWRESRSAAGTAVERYLRSRNITIPVRGILPGGAVAPAT